MRTIEKKYLMKKRLLIFFFFTIGVIPITNSQQKEKDIRQGPLAIEGWFFRAISGYPVSITFEPLVLFKNGDYFEVGEEPLDEVEIGTSKQQKPKAWGKWQLKNGVYYLTNYKGKTVDYKLGSGNWFPAYAYHKSLPLKNVYKRTSGGDYGNGTHALIINKISFLDNQYFEEGTNSGISTPSSAAWKKSKNAGTYTIDEHTLTLRYNDGREVRRSFAVGASGSPARPSMNMLFIGGDVFVDAD